MRLLQFSVVFLFQLIAHKNSIGVFAQTVTLNVTDKKAEISNGLFTAKISSGTVQSLVVDGKELIGKAKGFYSSINGGTGFSATGIKTVTQTASLVDVAFTSNWGELHYVVNSDVKGIYSYFVATGIATVEEFRTIYRVDGSMFRNGYNVERSGAFPTLAEVEKATVIQDDTYQLADGTVYTKYNWASYVADDWYHGVYGSGHGVWLLSASHEYINGGPMKQELMVHIESNTGDGVVLNMLSAAHFGTPSVHIPSGKIYGPWLLYFNDGSSSDAASRSTIERNSWPYSWMTDSHYPLTRSTVTGTIKLSDGRASSGAMVVLAKPGGDLYSQGTDYIYWSKADSSGAFSIPHVRANTYTLYAYADGGVIGDITDQFAKDGIQVSGTSTSLGEITWSPPKYSYLLWQIGTADRKAKEFNLGNLPRQYGLFKKVPATLTFTVGTSKEASNWYYAQTSAGTWTIEFTLNQTYTGNAHLTIAQAGQSRAVTIEVSVNGKSIGSVPTFTNDAAIYRSANPSGYYHLSTISFAASALKSGSNTVALHATAISDGGGIMYDTIKLEVD